MHAFLLTFSAGVVFKFGHCVECFIIVASWTFVETSSGFPIRALKVVYSFQKCNGQNLHLLNMQTEEIFIFTHLYAWNFPFWWLYENTKFFKLYSPRCLLPLLYVCYYHYISFCPSAFLLRDLLFTLLLQLFLFATVFFILFVFNSFG